MPGPRDARELKRMNRVLAGILKDKDRARRKRRLAGAASPSRHEPPTRRKPELEPEPEDWDLETAEPGDDSRRTLARAVPPPGAATEAPMAVDSLLTRPEFPLSARYDRDWLLDNQMGPNAIWLLEWLLEALDLAPGTRVLDLGCGRAMTSVFLAREKAVRVWAADLWMSPDHNWRRASEAGVADLVCPLRAEAHALPFAQGFFDAIVSIDSYQYFGTDDLYLAYLSGFLRPGGRLGIVVPGLTREIREPPEHLTRPQANGKVFWEDACWCFHTADWWRASWTRCSQVEDVRAELLPDGWRHWRDFERALEQAGKQVFPSDAEALDRDQGRTIGFVRALARRTAAPAENLYDPGLGIRAGVDR